MNNIYQGDTKVHKAKIQTYRTQFEGLEMQEEENIASYFQRVEEVVNTMRGLGDAVQEAIVVQKVLRSLSAWFNPKFSAIEVKENLDALKLDETHGILISYKMRT